MHYGKFLRFLIREGLKVMDFLFLFLFFFYTRNQSSEGSVRFAEPYCLEGKRKF